jgi:hypothetical protein
MGSLSAGTDAAHRSVTWLCFDLRTKICAETKECAVNNHDLDEVGSIVMVSSSRRTWMMHEAGPRPSLMRDQLWTLKLELVLPFVPTYLHIVGDTAMSNARFSLLVMVIPVIWYGR